MLLMQDGMIAGILALKRSREETGRQMGMLRSSMRLQISKALDTTYQ